jgi:hypothetical protein
MTHRYSQLRMNKTIVNILLDSDVIIHFVKGDRVSTLIELFPRRMMMLDRVDEELRKNKTRQKTIFYPPQRVSKLGL